MVLKEQVQKALERVIDPELGVDIVTMGLIYAIDITDEKTIRILMTFTSPMCPQGEALQEEVRTTVQSLGFSDSTVDITFDPAWKPPQILKEMMGMTT